MIVAFSIPKEYTVNATLIREKYNDSSLLGLMDQFSSIDAFSPFTYPDLFENPIFLKPLLDIQIQNEEGVKSTLRGYLNNNLSNPWWLNIINKFKIEDNKNYKISKNSFSIEEWNTINLLKDRISFLVNRKTLSLTISVRLQDPSIAYIVADTLSQNIQRLFSEYRAEKVDNEYQQAKIQNYAAKKRYYELHDKYMAFMDSCNGRLNNKERIKCEILKNETDQSLYFYNQSSMHLHNSKIKAYEKGPAFYVLIPPIIPCKPSYPSIPIVVLGFFIIGSVFSLWFIFKTKTYSDVG